MLRGGQPGNNNGGKGKAFTDALRLAANREVIGDKAGRTYLAKAAQECAECAANGEPWAIKEMADRLDGKPAQAIEANVLHSVEVIERVVIDQPAEEIEYTNGKGIHPAS